MKSSFLLFGAQAPVFREITVTLLESKFQNARGFAQRGDLQAALEVLKTVSPVDTVRMDYKIFRARILLALGRGDDAMSDIGEISDSNITPRLLAFRADIEERLGRTDAAIHTLTRALELAEDASLLARRASLHQVLGAFENARSDFLDAIALRPEEGQLYRLYAQLHKFTGDEPMSVKMRKAVASDTLPDQQKMDFEFALAKVADDMGQYKEAMAFLTSANAKMRAFFPYDIAQRVAAVARYKSVFENFTAQDHVVPDASDYAPIFITGMPRSGTTLAEQILSSHAHVDGGGETAKFSGLMHETLGDPLSDNFDLSPSKIRLLAQRYHSDMLDKLHLAKRHTDKSMQSIMYAGPILAALPKAKIIVITRDPRAISLSNFKHVFRPGKHLQSYKLDDIRTYQDGFNQMVDFWQARLPDAILQVAYEDLVTAPERVIRQILDFVGLEWDAACLKPEDNARSISTLSAVDVRRPINTSAIDNWRAYEAYL
ncbi:MAG: sulfotransferase [Pseudomonadota bacterium]